MKFYIQKNRKNLVTIDKSSQIDSLKKTTKNIPLSLLFKVYFMIFFGLFLLVPTIYIKNQIYYNSRDISVLLDEYAVLYEENQELRKKIEYVRYRSQILDVIEIK